MCLVFFARKILKFKYIQVETIYSLAFSSPTMFSLVGISLELMTLYS